MASRARTGAAEGRGPVRTCIGCRRTGPPEALVRVVARPDGSLATGRGLGGRGAWLCAGSPACFEAAARRGAFSRALGRQVDPESVGALRALLGGGHGDAGGVRG